MSKISSFIVRAEGTSIGSFKPVTENRQPTDLTSSSNVLGALEGWVSDIVGLITILATLFFIVYAFIAAFNWITAAGEKGKIEKAKDRLIWSTLGLILIVATYAIIGLIGGIIGLELLKPADMLQSVIPGGV